MRNGPDIWPSGTFGPFGFDATARKCKTFHHFDVKSLFIWSLKGRRARRANDAFIAIRDRLMEAQVPKLRQGIETQINL